MKKYFYTFLSRPITTTMFFFCVVILGIVSFLNLPIELSPNIEYPKLSVSTSWSGVSPETMEAQVTSVLESQLASIKGIEKISSTSEKGYSNIDLEFHSDVDMDFIRIEINEALYSIKNDLPYGVSRPKLSPYIPSDMQELQGFMTFTVSAPISSNEIRKTVEEEFRYSLMAIEGISDIDIRGGNERLINIIIDYERVKAYEISNEEINNAIANAEQIQSIGSIKNSGSQIFVKVKNELHNPSELENILIKNYGNGNFIQLKDIGKVVDDYKERTSFYRIDGNETVSLIISKEPGTNTLKLAESVQNAITNISAKLPQGYIVTKKIDKSERIKTELEELTTSGVYSSIIIVILLLLIFRRLSTSIIVIISIVFSILFAFILFFIFDLSLDILSIAAFILGFGFMVDNSIVVIDYIEKHYTKKDIRYLTVILKNIYTPVFAATLTTVAVFIPLVFLTGELKLYFEKFAIGIAATLSASLLISFTIVPLLYSKFVNEVKEKNEKGDNKLIFKLYSLLLQGIKRWKKIVAVFIILLFGLPVWLLPPSIEIPYIAPIYNSIHDSEFFTEYKSYMQFALGGSINLFFNYIDRGRVWSYGDETYLYVRISLPNGNKIDRINKLSKDLESEVLNYSENIKNVVANVFDEENVSIKIDFSKEQSLSSFPYMLKNYLSAYAARIGGASISVTGFGPGFSTGGASFSNFSVNLKGYNYLKVKELAEEYKSVIERNPRIDNVDIDRSYRYSSDDVYEIIGFINRNRLGAYKISTQSFFNNIAKTTDGNLAWNKFRIGEEEVEYSIKFSNYNSIQQKNLEDLIVQNDYGQLAKVKDVVTFEERKVLSSILREDQQYLRRISFDFKGPYKYGKKFVESSIEKVNIPEGYSIKPSEFNFSFGEEEEIDIWSILGIAVLLIFMITAGLFESYKKPLIILTAIPFATMGTIILFYFSEYTMDRGAYAGILLLIGLSVNNSIILVDYLSSNLIKGTVDFNRIVSLSYNRLRPIFTTTVTTIAALIPLLLGADSSFWKSLSLSVIGGILFSSIFVSVLVPLFYYQLAVKKNNN